MEFLVKLVGSVAVVIVAATAATHFLPQHTYAAGVTAILVAWGCGYISRG